MPRYAVAAWTVIWAAAGVVYGVRHHGVPVWMFAVAAGYAVLLAFFRDRWRGKYLDLKNGPPLPDPVQVRTIRLAPPRPRDPPEDGHL
jgi:hypothetical protein